jgi:hypothetical protein
MRPGLPGTCDFARKRLRRGSRAKTQSRKETKKTTKDYSAARMKSQASDIQFVFMRLNFAP